MPRPHISFFGIVTAKNSSGEKISLHGRKTSALLAYLLVTKREQSRDALANLFWPDLNEKDSKNNFRVALARISKRLGTTDKPFLLADRKTVQFNPEAIMDIDIHQFEKSINASKIHEHNSRAGCASCCKALTKAVALYQAEFMQGFFLEGCDTYDEWQLLSREQYHLEALTALNDLSTFHETNGNYLEAEKHTRRQLSLEPLSEEAQRRLLRLLSFQDKRNAALEHFQSYQDYLLKELEVEPEDETVNLFHQIQTGMLEKPKLKNTPKTQMQPGIDELELRAGIHNLGTDTTPFFGREDEVLKLREYLAEKRLITILGIGGTGKTRLATELARTQINSFHDGVFALRLAPLQNPEDIPTVLAEALKFNFQQGADFKSQVLNQIKDKNMLFVMDNFEHLIEGRSIIQDILQAAPEIKIIVTSREKLNLSTEAAYKLSGLSYPNEGETQSEVVHSSTQLFIETAKWAQLDFKLDLLDLRHIDKICQIVQGHPLAIVLAASWLESLNCEEIVEELTESIEFLETDMHDVPERQRSIRAAFNYSWQLLSPEEQSIYASLSVFRGGFNRSAAKEVSGASLRQLTSLLNKSLIQHLPSQGRYELHELMRQFAEEKLIELGQGSHIKHQHSKYYLTTLQTLQEDFQLGNQVPSVKSFEADYENMRAAWQAAVSKEYMELIRIGANGLRTMCVLLSRYQTLIQLLEPVLELIPKDSSDLDEKNLELKLLMSLGIAYISMGGFIAPKAKESFERATELTISLETSPELFATLNGLGAYYWCIVDFDRCLKVIAQWRERLSHSPRGTGHEQRERYLDDAEVVLSFIEGAIRYQLGEFKLAQEILNQGIALYEPEHHVEYTMTYGQDPSVFCRYWLSRSYWALGSFDKAKEVAQEAIDIAKGFDHPFTKMFANCAALDLANFAKDYKDIAKNAKIVQQYSTENSFVVFQAISELSRGLSLCNPSNDDATRKQGLTLMEKNLSIFTIQMTTKETYAVHIAQVYIQEKLYKKALNLIEETIKFSETTQSYCAYAELLQLKAQVLVAEDSKQEAEKLFTQAIETAKKQEANTLELRATTSYALFLKSQGEVKKAKSLISTIYEQFDQGFATADLQDAKTVLENLEKELKV